MRELAETRLAEVLAAEKPPVPISRSRGVEHVEHWNTPPPAPPPPDLSYALEEVRAQLPDLSPGQREVFDYAAEIYLSEGVPQEEAERGAFAITLGKGPKKLKRMGIWRDEGREP